MLTACVLRNKLSHVPDVSLAEWVGIPGPVGGADGVDVLAGDAVEGADGAGLGDGAVAGDGLAEVRDLLLLPGDVFDATGLVRPPAAGLKTNE